MSDEELEAKPCLVCGILDKQKPMCFRGELWCSDDHRKVVKREKLPTDIEWVTMDADLWTAWKIARPDITPTRCEPEELGSFSARSSLGRPW